MRAFDNVLRAVAMLGFGLCVAALPDSAGAATEISVASPAALAGALAAAAPGAVITLAGGDYGALVLKDMGGGAGEPITLRSADPGAPARFSTMDLRQVRHVVLDGLTFDYSFAAGDKPFLRPFQMSDGQDITIRNSLFDGDDATGASAQDDGFPTGFGLSLRGMTGAVLAHNEIRGFYRGLVVGESSDLVVQDNDVHDIRSDGMDFAQVERVRIEGNHIHDFRRVPDSADHADMIQFWTNGTTKPSSDITIRGNILNSGTGWFTQSIFMRNDQVDRGLAGPEMFYRRITIADNVIINAHLHGITVGETAGLVIANNTLIHNACSQGKEDNPGLWTPQIRVAPTSTGVRVVQNVVSKVAGYDKQADWTVTGNFLVQDRFPSQPGFYDTVFLAARTGDPRDLMSFTYLKGGPLDGIGIGAPQLDLASAALSAGAVAHPVIRVIPDPRYANQFRFDASASILPQGTPADQTSFAWVLDDGTTLSGPTIDHVFARTGPHQITLTLTLPDGSTATSYGTVTIADPEVLEFSSETGTFTSFAGGEPMIVPNLDLGTGPAVLGQGSVPIMIRPGRIAPFFQADDFELRLRLRTAGDHKSAGELLRIHQSLLVTVTGRGTLDVRFDTATAKLHLMTSPVNELFSGAWHDIALRYSAGTGLFTVTADGATIGQGKTSGTTRPMEHWGLALGNPFAKGKSFDGALDSLSLRANQDGSTAAN